jgi:hypothetical protein
LADFSQSQVDKAAFEWDIFPALMWIPPLQLLGGQVKLADPVDLEYLVEVNLEI